MAKWFLTANSWMVPENFLQKTKCLKHLLKLYVGSLQNTGKTNLHFSEYMFNENRLFCFGL